MIIEQILFTLVAGAAIVIFSRSAKKIYRNIFLGKAETINDNIPQRFRNMLLIAFGQKKMFKRPIPALLHLCIYVSFIIINIEILEIFVDGIFGTHRFFGRLEWFQGIYTFAISFIEVLALLALIAAIVFFIRRNVLKIPRFQGTDLKGFPWLDANVILVFEAALMVFILTMTGCDYTLQVRNFGHYTLTQSGEPLHFWVSAHLLFPLFNSIGSSAALHIIERLAWWGHIVGVFAYLNYLPYSKHLHILLAFPNTFYSRLTPKGTIQNMPEITKEIKLMLNPEAVPEPTPAEPIKFGAKDVFDLSWKNLLDAYACTECGRCTTCCPANNTGKLLSPRKIMMDTRDRLEEVGRAIDANNGVWKDDGKSLIGADYITVEELRACTTCNACVEECPVTINPLDIIVQLRRNLIMEDSNSPAEWTGMFSNIENNAAPWQFSQQDRLNWVKG